MIDQDTLKKMAFLQKGEITDYVIYQKLAKKQKIHKNKEVLENIAKDELDHYNYLATFTNQKHKPKQLHVWFFFIVARVFGLTFGIKLMEKGEVKTQHIYDEIKNKADGIQKIIEDEEEHEKELIETLDEEKLKYISSIVLGLNDALVELTGTLAGLTFALSQNARIVAIAGLITGIAAALSMASSEYLSTKQDESHSFALKSSLYTGIAYIFAVFFLVLPYFLFTNVYYALLTTIVIVILIVLFFNYYISIAKDFSFKKRFLEMVIISLSVSALSFGLGWLVNHFFGVS